MGEYDLIVVVNVLYVMVNMIIIMKNVRSLLKLRGKVILFEVNRYVFIMLLFVLLLGWWYVEDDYCDWELGLLFVLESWNRFFVDIGFIGVDVLY